MSNTIRFDLSDKLIHFFRDVDAESSDSPPMPEHFAFNSFVEETKYPALFLLRSAIRMERLWATWSVRGGARTIYGPRPAVCFSEMPLSAFLESSAARSKKGEAMTSYALTFGKRALYDCGANPVIYGLSNRQASPPPGKGGGPRIFPESVLPHDEQYRYVTYAPTLNRPIDWTHEREWRLPYAGDLSAYESELREFGHISDAQLVPHIRIDDPSLPGIGVIVKNTKEVAFIKADVLSLIDRGVVADGHFNHILDISRLPPSKDLYDPTAVRQAISGATITFDGYFNLPVAKVTASVEQLRTWVQRVEQRSGVPEHGAFGGCWLWLLDSTHPFVRALVQDGRVIVSKDGRYLARLYEFGDSRSVAQREEMALEVAKLVAAEHGIDCTYFSVLGSDDVDGIPFNVGQEFLENKFFYNINF